MGNLAFSSGPGAPTAQASVTSTATPTPTGRLLVTDPRGELSRQTPHEFGYTLQQFVRLAGAQCRMSAEEVAYRNRLHGSLKRTA